MYICQQCSYNSATKLWKCPNCWAFGSFIEDENKNKLKKSNTKTWLNSWKILQSWNKTWIWFYEIGNKELNRVFKRGIKKAWIYLLWWEPWIGKSTMMLQIVDEILKLNKEVNIGYFSWEENEDQISDRIDRINLSSLKDSIEIYHTSDLEDIITTTKNKNYDMIIIDSIQTVYKTWLDAAAGSVNQVKICSEKISEFCKSNHITAIIIWHVTKWWEIAWPKYLEHIVDAVLYLEWDRYGQYRFLRSKKNRFESTDDVAIFEMCLFWLTPVYNLKERIINWANTNIPWNVLTVGLDNSRPVIVNLEVLINKTKFKFPQRTALWIDQNRLDLVIAILERYLKINLWLFDIYVNIPWEFKFYDSWLDLAIAVAILWQYKNKIIDKKYIFLWELWLGWQLLKSKLHEKRLKEIPQWFEIIDSNKIKNIVEIMNYI